MLSAVAAATAPAIAKRTFRILLALLEAYALARDPTMARLGHSRWRGPQFPLATSARKLTPGKLWGNEEEVA